MLGTRDIKGVDYEQPGPPRSGPAGSPRPVQQLVELGLREPAVRTAVYGDVAAYRLRILGTWYVVN